MSSGLRALLARLPVGRQQVAVAAYYARRTLSTIDNPEVAKGRRLLRRMRTSPPDVLYLGDSALSFVSGRDADTRNLAQLVIARLGPDLRTLAVHGGSYHPALHDAYLRLLEGAPARPIVIVPLCIRVRTVPWVHHPIYGHRRATEYLARVDQYGSPRRIRAGFPRATATDFARFHELPFPTWAGDRTIGDYVKTIKSFAPDDPERVKWLYAYHHGGVVMPGQPMADIERMGKRLRELGVPVVVYETPVPIEHGTALWGERFRELAENNFAQLGSALRRGYESDLPILGTGTKFPSSAFIDPEDASEHLNEIGRSQLTEDIAAAVREHGVDLRTGRS